MAATALILDSPFPASQSIFSVDAPEFVSKHSTLVAVGTGMDNIVQQPCTRKKKKKKKKATSSSSASLDLKCDDGEEKTRSSQTTASEPKTCNPGKLGHSSTIGLPKSPIGDKVHLPGKPSQISRKNQPVKEIKSVRFQETSSEDKKHLKIKKLEILTKNKSGKEAKLVRFQSSEEDKERITISRPELSSKHESSKEASTGTWPKHPVSATQSQECSKRPAKMSFADKLKSPAPTKSPYLDWRDQRTNAVNAPIKSNPNIMVCRDEKAHDQRVTLTTADEAFNNDGFETVSRKKIKDKKPEKVTEEVIKPVTEGKVSASGEGDAKKQLEKERKKLREKQKKKQARDEKLLAEKLAPKGQKVTIITPKLMQQFLQSERSTVGTSKPVMKLNEDMFPALGKHGVKGNVPESESEWETTEIEVLQKEPVMTQRNVKRSDPIEFDLMALITKKNTKKKTTSENSKKSKNRPGIVANVLDRSAPTLSRGKIRNKKRKLSEIRKALLVAKAKKKIIHELEVPAIRPNATRPHVLHSKKFREYCDQMLTDEIDLLARDMLYHLRMFQDRVYKKDPIKGAYTTFNIL